MTKAEHVDHPVLVETPDGPRLRGSECAECSTVTFPAQASCPACTGVAVADRPLGARGTLWTWTVQTFGPKAPYRGGAEFEPFGVGYVELPGEVRVEARLTEADPRRLRIGLEVELRVIDVPGVPGATTYAFAPVEEGDR